MKGLELARFAIASLGEESLEGLSDMSLDSSSSSCSLITNWFRSSSSRVELFPIRSVKQISLNVGHVSALGSPLFHRDHA